MSSKQTLAQVPADVNDVLSLKRFLLQLVENLDTIVGYRGSKSYVTAETFTQEGASLGEIIETAKSNSETISTLEEKQKDLTERVANLEEEEKPEFDFFKTKVIGSDYHDFNAAAWSQLKGRFEFTTLGENLVNPPSPATTGTEYRTLVDSTSTSGDVWQEVVFDNKKFLRIGVGNAWIQLSNETTP